MEWISVVDNLPEEKEFVLCMLKYSDGIVRPRVGWTRRWSSGPYFVVPHSPDENAKWEVTHWMIIPEFKEETN